MQIIMWLDDNWVFNIQKRNLINYDDVYSLLIFDQPRNLNETVIIESFGIKLKIIKLK